MLLGQRDRSTAPHHAREYAESLWEGGSRFFTVDVVPSTPHNFASVRAGVRAIRGALLDSPLRVCLDDAGSICGTGGRDEITVAKDGKVVYAGRGNDEIIVTGSGSIIVAGPGRDSVVVKGAENTVVKGGSGSDELVGRGGADVLKGGDDDDVLRGGKGPDKLYGGSGQDSCSGGSGRDTIKGCDA